MTETTHNEFMTVKEAMDATWLSYASVYRKFKPKDNLVRSDLVRQFLTQDVATNKPGWVTEEWQSALRLTKGGSVEPSDHNLRSILENDRDVSGCFGWDEFSCQTSITGELPDMPAGVTRAIPRSVSDEDVFIISCWLGKKYTGQFSHKQIDSSISSVAVTQPFNSFVTQMEEWAQYGSGDLLNSWLIEYLGCPDTAYVRQVGRYFILGAVARAMFENTKMDNVLFLEGKQGITKSTACEILAIKRDWFLPNIGDIRNKEAYMQMAGKLIVEIAERSGMMKANENEQKEFFSKAQDVYVPKYSNKSIRVRRSCVFIATTNDHRYLGDPTGGRRYWPVSCGAIDHDGLRLDNKRIWAEAYAVLMSIPQCENEHCRRAWKNGKLDPNMTSYLCHAHRWWPDAHEQEKYFSPEQSKRTMVDEVELRKVSAYMKRRITREPVTTEEIVTQAIIPMPGQSTIPIQRRVHSIMYQLGFSESMETREGVQQTYWEKK